LKIGKIYYELFQETRPLIKIRHFRVPENEILLNVFKRTIEANSKCVSLNDFALDKVHIFMAAEHTPGQNGRYCFVLIRPTLFTMSPFTIFCFIATFKVPSD
jgi:hypothetical protein